MLRQKVERESMGILYLFQLRLKFTSGLGKRDNSLSDKQVVSTFTECPLLHLKQLVYREFIACYDETHKIQV